MYTIDASVFINAFNPHETGHQASRDFLAAAQQQRTPILVPTLVLPELTAAIGRGCGNAQLARDFALQIARLPQLLLVDLDTTLAYQALAIAADYRLRGSDAVYAAVALRFGCTLISLDREQCARIAGILPTRSPAEALGEK